MKRKHSFYTHLQRAEALENAKIGGIRFAATIGNIPQSTVRTWVKQAGERPNRLLSIIRWLMIFFGTFTMGLVALAGGVSLGILALGGRGDLRAFWEFVLSFF